MGAEVLVHDPYVKDTLKLSDVLKNPDIVVLATNHKYFSNIVDEIKKSNCKIVFDVWHIYKKSDFPNCSYYSFGRGIDIL